MSALTYNIILIIASILSILPPILLVIKEAIKLKMNSKGNTPHRIKIESESGIIIELDLHKQNDTKKIHQTVEMLLGR